MNIVDIDEDQLSKNFKTQCDSSSLNGSSEYNELSERSRITSTSEKSTLGTSSERNSGRGKQMILPKDDGNLKSSHSAYCSKRSVSVPDGRITEIGKHAKKQKWGQSVH